MPQEILGTAVALMLAALATHALADLPPVNYDEAKIPPYTLPDPLIMLDGTPVTDAEMWLDERRPEILELFETQVYGRAPAPPKGLAFRVWDEDPNALGGKATRKQVSVFPTGDPHEACFELLLYIPNQVEGAAPVFLGLNFRGNQVIHPDPAIKITENWVFDREVGSEGNRATDASRGQQASNWPVDLILDRGYALGTVYYGDIDPDFDDGFANGIQPLYYGAGQTKPAKDEWGSIAAWAWGLSRVLDYLERDGDVDAARTAVIGHSRLGKTALWAGAVDSRFALVISNNSGCGGAALSRRAIGETVERINTVFPHWFCDNFNQYNAREDALPVDQHMLLALIAPRPVYVASATEDLWADPRGEFLSCVGADPVYKLLGLEGLPTLETPPADTPVQGSIGYHLRTGKHEMSEYDWRQYLDFADRWM